jgi:tetratricopeptide (TPR) repeat protein
MEINYFEVAEKYYASKNYERAIENFDVFIKTSNDLSRKTSSLYNIGVCYLKLKNYDKAILYLEEAILLKEESSYYFNLGYCHAVLKDYKKAIEYFKIAFKLNPYDVATTKALETLKNYDVEDIGDVEDISVSKNNLDNLSKNDKLNMLLSEIELAVAIGNKTWFIQLTSEFNTLKETKEEDII